MGKKLEIAAFTTASIGFPVKEGTWDFLQLAYIERINAAIQTIIGVNYSASSVYILYGCLASVSGSNTNFTAGALYYNGDVYLLSSQTVATPSGSNIFVVNVVLTQYTTNADPVAFVGGTNENVHNIYSASIGTGLTGTGNLSGNSASDFNKLLQSSTGNWINPTAFGSGWNSSTSTLQACLDGQGRVFYKGQIVSLSTPSAIIAEFPAKYAPLASVGGFFVVPFYNPGTTNWGRVVLSIGFTGPTCFIGFANTSDIPSSASYGFDFTGISFLNN